MNSKKTYLLIEDVLQKATELRVSEILPKVYTLTKILGDKDFEKWVLLEMSGYVNTNNALTEDVKVPSYRMIPGQFNDKYGRVIHFEDPELFKLVNSYPIREGVSEIEAISEREGIQTATNAIINDIIKRNLGIEVTQFAFNPISFKSILTEIQSRIISWLSDKRNEILLINDNAISPAIPKQLSNLHPIVQKIAGQLFEDGHYRQAILDTYIALIEAVKNKSGLELDNTRLMQNAFSMNNPTLSISDDPDERQGFMWLYSGAVMAIRNPKAHRLIEQNDPQRTIEWLSFASVLLRVLDDSTLQK